MTRKVSWPGLLVIAAAVAVTIVSAYLLSSWPPEPPTGAAAPARPAEASPAPAASPTEPPTTEPEDVTLAVLGDSFSGGWPEFTGAFWPELLEDSLGWEVVNDSVPASGYLAAGRGEPFGERVDAIVQSEPDVVLVAGGINDLSAEPEEVAAAAGEVLGRVADGLPEAQVVLVSPFSDGEPGPLTQGLADRLEEVAASADVAYLDATRFLLSPDLLGPDGFHPSEQGQRRLAEELESALTELEVDQVQRP